LFEIIISPLVTLHYKKGCNCSWCSQTAPCLHKHANTQTHKHTHRTITPPLLWMCTHG